ncbi:MAG: lytic murein transglycosylase, partial [Geopsychrobacter sp.]|nr:lytic murein transglycosylase [Geopsychrobacter sp.]
ALNTLAFHYPKRADFFRSEFEQFLLLAREQGFDPLSLKGSYAGAMGMPQFISSSYRHYAIDFDGDDTIDIWNSAPETLYRHSRFSFSCH